jgi:hypothetical protein
MRCDCASVPMRGSRLAGLLSMRKTTVLGSRGAERQPEADAMKQRAQNAPTRPITYVTCPRIAGRFAPVAAGTLPGRRCHVCHASSANAAASLASRAAEVFARGQLAAQRLKSLRQHRHQRMIARAAAGDDVVHADTLLASCAHFLCTNFL